MSAMVEVRVPNLDCEGCASKLKKALFKLKGTYIYIYILVARTQIKSSGSELKFEFLMMSFRSGRGGSRNGDTKDYSERVCAGGKESA